MRNEALLWKLWDKAYSELSPNPAHSEGNKAVIMNFISDLRKIGEISGMTAMCYTPGEEFRFLQGFPYARGYRKYLDIFEKVTDGVETWYEEITKDPKGLPNAYYALVKVEEKYVPLPMFFEFSQYRGMGDTILECQEHDYVHLQHRLSEWVKGYVESWTA